MARWMQVPRGENPRAGSPEIHQIAYTSGATRKAKIMISRSFLNTSSGQSSPETHGTQEDRNGVSPAGGFELL